MTQEHPHILLVDDDEALTALVSRYLIDNGFRVSVSHGDEPVEELVAADTPDLIILDVMLPNADGLSICRAVRPGYRGSILMLTALGDDIDEVAGLELGADDYLVKPVRPRVLLARIRALLRRAPGTGGRASESASDAPLVACAGALCVDSQAREATLDGAAVALTDAEFDLLHLLATRAGEVLSRDDINRSLRGLEHDGVDRTIDLRVSRLRKKLGDGGAEHRLLKSVRGKGYLLLP